LIRAAWLALPALLAFTTPAEASFQTCTYDAGTKVVTATFGAGTAGALKVNGTAIQADGANCGAATTTNTDRIDVVGDADTETMTLDLSGGAFAPGFTDEGDGSSEIEIFVDLKQQQVGMVSTITILGGAGDDHFLAGQTGGVSQVNLNDAGTDADGDLFTLAAPLDVLAGGGNDTVSERGLPDFTNPYGGEVQVSGGPGDDDLTAHSTFFRGGPGDDHLTFPLSSGSTRIGIVMYDQAAGPVTILLPTGTAVGGDGDGGTDTFGTLPGEVIGSSHDDDFEGDAGPSLFFGGDGADTMEGGGGADGLFGGAGEDDLDGEEGDDVLGGDDDDDLVRGGLDDDVLVGGAGDDDLRGDDGDDLLDESSSPPAGTPDGDDLHGGEGSDLLQYGLVDPFYFLFSAYLAGRTAPVSVSLDGAANDGEAGEQDNAQPDIEQVVGGRGDDTLVGNDEANVLGGFDGGDTLRGGGGADVLSGVGVPDDPGGMDEQLRALVVDEGDDIDGGGGADTIDADAGDDLVRVRDGVHDTVDCGPGNDAGERDAADDVASNCEALALPVEMPPEQPIVPPPAQTPPIQQPPAQQPPVVTPPAPPAVSVLLRLPSSRRCASRRKFTVRVRREIRGTVKRVQIFVNGKRVKSVTGRRIALPIDLRGLPKGKIKVRLRVELNDGRVATDTRTYRTCATRKRKGQFGTRKRP
jgi:Ca2+-binding RTX toxin-like protein